MLHLFQRLKLFTLLVMLLMLLTTAVSVQAETPAHTDGVYHTVQYGEYLGSIAHRYGVTVHAILAANPQISNPNLIYYGTLIFIPSSAPPAPPPPPPQTCRFYHYVRYGENLSGIGNWYGVNPYRVAEANHIYNLNQIYAGQYLCIP